MSAVVFSGVCCLLLITGPLPAPYVASVVALLALLIWLTEPPEARP